MALAIDRRQICRSCAGFIEPGEPYFVQPDVAGVGVDTILCLRCGPEDERLACVRCGEAIDLGSEKVIHTYCAKGDEEDE